MQKKKRSILKSIALPLLGKELVEQAARRRTYIIRTFYAILLVGGYLLIAFEETRHLTGLNALGRGRNVFFGLVALQFAGICLFLPAMVSGAITGEKERDNLGLILLTGLGPRSILLQKLYSRLLPMVCLILLSVPSMAVTYLMGGVSANQIGAAAWTLLLLAMQVGTLSLMCSAFFRTTAAAFISTYIIGTFVVFCIPVLEAMRITNFHRKRGLVFDLLQQTGVFQILTDIGFISHPRDLLFMHMPPYLFFEKAWTGATKELYMVQSLPVILMSLFFFEASRFFLVRRAFAPPMRPLLWLLKQFDRIFLRLNRFTGGVVLMGHGELPNKKPIGWRETQKKSFGTTRYLIRILVVLIPLILCYGIWVMTLESYYAYDWLHFAVFAFWIMTPIVVSAKAASLMASERSHQTLEILLTTPLDTSELIRQKLIGVYRLIAALMIPFVCMLLFATWWRDELARMGGRNYYYFTQHWDVTLYGVTSVVTAFIYLPMVAWLSFLIGMFIKTQSKAIMVAIGSVIGWCLIPPMLLAPFAMLIQPDNESPFNVMLLFSPMIIVGVNEFNELGIFAGSPWFAVVANSIWYGSMALLLRVLCTVTASWLLGRREPVTGALSDQSSGNAPPQPEFAVPAGNSSE